MKSIRELYRIGTGPSSSHTMGPRKAAEIFLGKHPEAKAFQVTLYGSLAATGKGHMTDVAILDTLQPHAPTEIIWKAHVFYPFHPCCHNALRPRRARLSETPRPRSRMCG